MTSDFTPEQAATMVALISSIVAPFIVSFIKRAHWRPWQSLLLALGVSLAGGALSAYAEGRLTGGSVLGMGLEVFVFSQAHYTSWFQALGLEDWLNPEPQILAPVEGSERA